MQLVGYSNTAQKTLESNAILWWRNILGKNIGQERCTKKGIYACLVDVKEVGIRRRNEVALQLLGLPKHNNTRKETT